MTKTISINDATIDTEVFRQYNKQAQEALRDADEAKAEFEDICEVVENTTAIKKSDVSAFFKARYKDNTDKVIAKGNLYETLNEALDD